MGSEPAMFSLPAPEPGPGVVPQPGKQLAAAVGVAKEHFSTRLSDPERPKPTPEDSGGCVPPTVWATHPSQQLAMAPSLGLCPLHLFSLRETRKYV